MDIPWNVPLSYGTMGWDGQWDTHASVKGQVDIPWNVPWDCGMRWTIPLSDGTMGWDGQWDTHASVEGQVDIPWNVPLSHGTVGWDGQFTAFLDIYELMSGIACCKGPTNRHEKKESVS